MDLTIKRIEEMLAAASPGPYDHDIQENPTGDATARVMGEWFAEQMRSSEAVSGSMALHYMTIPHGELPGRTLIVAITGNGPTSAANADLFAAAPALARLVLELEKALAPFTSCCTPRWIRYPNDGGTSGSRLVRCGKCDGCRARALLSRLRGEGETASESEVE